MNLANLKPVITALLGQGSSTSNLTIGSTDMFLVAANNARRNAELLHNFELTRVEGTLSIDGSTGASLDDVVFENTNPVATVTGTLSPDATGTYTQQGTYQGYPLYGRIQEFFLRYSNTNGRWVLSDTSDGWDDSTNHWIKTSDLTNPVGTYTANGTNTGTATIAVTETVSLKEVVAFSRTLSSGLRIPVPFASISGAIERDRVIEESTGFYVGQVRFPSDADILARNGYMTVAQRGRRVYIRPQQSVSAEPIDLIVEGYRWLPEYTAAMVSDTNAAAQDFFLQYGTTYMQWAIVCELNYMLKNFVPRTEGNLSPPEQAREDAWRRLLLWDSYMVDSHTNRTT